jgi:hypothetical protein
MGIVKTASIRWSDGPQAVESDGGSGDLERFALSCKDGAVTEFIQDLSRAELVRMHALLARVLADTDPVSGGVP